MVNVGKYTSPMDCMGSFQEWLVHGWTTRFEQYARHIGIISQGVKIENVWNHHLVKYLKCFMRCHDFLLVYGQNKNRALSLSRVGF